MKNISFTKRTLSLFFLCSSFFLLTGCTALKTAINTVLSPFEPEFLLPENIIVTVKGTLKEDDSLFSNYQFMTENEETFSIKKTKNFSKKLEYYTNKQVVITGLISQFSYNEETKDISLENTIQLIDIALFSTDTNNDSSWNIFTPHYFPIVFSHPAFHLSVEEKIISSQYTTDPISRIIAHYNNSLFFTITTNIDKGWKKKFTTDGTLLQFGKWNAYRIFSGKQILFYLPDLDIQIDYWGDTADIHLFYTIINSIQEKNDDTNTIKESKSLHTINTTLETPLLSTLIKDLLKNPSIHLEKTNIYANRIFIDKIEYFGNFCAVEYKILHEDKFSSVLQATPKKKLFSVEWKSIFYQEFYLQEIVEWHSGKKFIWETDANTPDIGIFSKYFLRNINTIYTQPLPQNYLLLLSPTYQYSIRYPKKMYYEVFTEDDIIEGVKWSNAPFNTNTEKNDFFDIKLSLQKGSIEKYTENFSDTTILIPKSESAHFVLQGNKNISFEIIQKMAKSIILY